MVAHWALQVCESELGEGSGRSYDEEDDGVRRGVGAPVVEEDEDGRRGTGRSGEGEALGGPTTVVGVEAPWTECARSSGKTTR